MPAIAAIFLALVADARAAKIATVRDCLYAGPSEGVADLEACGGDPVGYGSRPEIRAIEANLGVAGARIVFSGCRNDGFSASGDIEDGALAARVTYPLQQGAAFDPSYLAPLAHELGHVAQIQQAGSVKRLQAVLDSRRAELGADFLAGYALRAVSVGLNVTQFASNLSLAGQYVATPDDHGRPLERTNAFRMGFEYVRNNGDAVAASAHLAFQKTLLIEGAKR